MKTINELEKELREAKAKEQLADLQTQLDSLKRQFEGKAFGTHTFERRNRSSFNAALFYEKFWIKDSAILVLRWDISISRQAKNYAFSQDCLSFQKSKDVYEYQYACQYNTTKEISINKFMQIWNQGELVCDKLFDVYSKTIEEPPFDLLRIGTGADEEILASAFNYLKLDIIDITKYPEVFRVLQYKHLPFLQEQKYLPKIHAKQILEYQIRLWEIEKKNSILSDISRYDESIKTIKDFINKLNL